MSDRAKPIRIFFLSRTACLAKAERNRVLLRFACNSFSLLIVRSIDYLGGVPWEAKFNYRDLFFRVSLA